MRVWDIDPAYLNRSSLLAEHVEIHALFTILSENRKGYASHPETCRWRGKLAALCRRHDRVVREMIRRGFCHRSPLPGGRCGPRQRAYVDPPALQFTILRRKYRGKEKGRKPLPRRRSS